MLHTDQQLHEATEAPEGINLILCDIKDGGQKIAHSLYVTWTKTDSINEIATGRRVQRGNSSQLTQIEVKHAVRHQDIIEKAQAWVIIPLVKLIVSVSTTDISLCKKK